MLRYKTPCKERKCKDDAKYYCILCQDETCENHSHFVRETLNGLNDYVCDHCYSTCIETFEKKTEAHKDTCLLEAVVLLNEWKTICHKRMTANSGVDAYYVIQLDDRTDRFLENNGAKHARD